MKHIKIFFALLIVSIFSSSAQSQDYIFRVLGSKGTVTVNGVALKVGTKITAGQSVVMGQESYLGLAHNNGKTLELKTAGTYSTSDLEQKLGTTSNDFASKYAQLVMNELTASNDQSRFNQRVKTGSVSRRIDNNPIQVMLPEKSEVIFAPIVINWFEKDNTGDLSSNKYKVVIKNLFGDVLLEETVTGSSYVLKLNEEKFATQNGVTCSVFSADGSKMSSEFGLKHPKTVNLTTIKEDLGQMPKDDSALTKLIYARYYEDKELIVNALTAYEDAVRSSEVDQYKDLYKAFLDRWYLSREGKAIEAAQASE